ncbi:MAG: T9SS type A sorting domain-containing protein [Bacteroidota bacterium]
MKKNFIIALLMIHNCSMAQNQNSIWIFGDSAGVDFSNISNPVPVNSTMRGRGSCASISDSMGNLQFYAYTIVNTSDTSTHVNNNQNQLILNGDHIVGSGFYNELITLPMPDSTGKYYLFSSSLPAMQGLYYSIIDMNSNGGLGSVTQKNVLLNNISSIDGITAIKHGNGRDWWVISKPEGYMSPSNNDFYIYLITPYSISPLPIQSIGYVITTNAGCISFNKQGDKLLMTDWRNLIELFNFDRCTGQLSNSVIVEPEHIESGEHFSSCFSPDGSKIYITRALGGAGQEDSWLYQYNLNAVNIAASRDTIYHPIAPEQGGTIRLAPDDKVYISFGYYAYYFPFPDSMYYTGNMNLSVINRPDSLGDSCLFTPYSFYLGGKRTYYGLPNNPDYELGALIGSGCDSLVGVQSIKYDESRGDLHVFYHSGWQIAFINAEGLKGKKFSLAVFDLTGRQVFKETGKLSSSYFTKDLRCEQFANGMYVVTMSTEKEILSKKFIKE